MQAKPDEQHYIPIIDHCTCGARDIPASFSDVWIHPGQPDLGAIQYVYCPQCERVILHPAEIKGYVSEEELVGMGWKPTRVEDCGDNCIE